MLILSKGRRSAFTLIELIIVLAVLAILVSMAYPSFRGMVSNNKVLTLSTHFFRSLHLARSEAVKRNTSVFVCPFNNGSNTVWSNGWTVNVTNCSGNIIYQYINEESDISLQLPALINQFSFSNTGSVSPTFSAITCDSAGVAFQQQVSVTANGRIIQNGLSATGCP